MARWRADRTLAAMMTAHTAAVAEHPGVEPDGLHSDHLRAPVRRALGDPAAAVLSWESRSIYAPVNFDTTGVYRLTGRAARRGDVATWSLILKVTKSPAGLAPERVGAARELLAYRSGLL